jgi:guanylate kinase
MSSEPAGDGLLLLVSAPSGTGKTTVVERLVERRPQLVQSRSYTSRPARAGEQQGVDYNFISRERFESLIQQDAFLEWASIFGHLYGTGRRDIEAALASECDVVLVIDVQGARQVRSQRPDAVGVFVLPPSLEALETRLRGRNKDPEDAMQRRLETARREVDAVEEYNYVVINDDLDRCVAEIEAIVIAERARLARRRAVVDPIVKTFR